MNVELPPSQDSSSDPSFDPGSPKPRPRWPYAMAIVAAGAVYLLNPWRDPSPPPSEFPQPGALEDGSNAQPSAPREPGPDEPLPLSPAGRIPDRPATFAFRPAEGTKRHLVQLYDAEGQLRWTSDEVTNAACALPPSVALEEGRYFWRVVAMPRATSDPKTGRPSPLVAFELYHPS